MSDSARDFANQLYRLQITEYAVRAQKKQEEAVNASKGSSAKAPRSAIAPFTYAGLDMTSKLRELRRGVEAYIHQAPDQSFDDIKGNEEALAQLRDVIEGPFLHKELYEAYGMVPPKGALLVGPPGCGKTMFARAAASTMRKLGGKDTEYLIINGPELQSQYVGATEARIKAIFNYAAEYKKVNGHPLLVFIDEADAILPDRVNCYKYEAGQVAMFLAELDGVQESGVFLLLATNRPEAIDPAVLREGRCDMKIKISRPDRYAIEDILEKEFSAMPLKGKVPELVTAAVESLFDPFRVIYAGYGVVVKNGKVVSREGKDFCLEHTVTGAMAVGIPARAKRIAFLRDKASTTRTGVQVNDVIRAVDEVFAESKLLSHTYAIKEFSDAYSIEKENAEHSNQRLN